MNDPCPSWPAYRSAVFLADDLPAWPAFAIVTAFHPRGVLRDEASNLERDRALRSSLESAGVAPLRIVGCSPDLSHREPGWAVPMGRDDAIALGTAYEQNAVYWVVGGVLWLLSCPPNRAASEELGDFAPRRVGGLAAVPAVPRR